VTAVHVLAYTALRILVLAAALGLGYVLGLRSWLLVLVAVVMAAAASYIFLQGPRDAAASQLASGVDRSRRRQPVDVDAEHEDALDDAARPASAAAPDRGSEREGEPQEDSVRELHEPGVAQDGDEVTPPRAAEHPPGEQRGRDG
jgi:hypothetical protein